MGIKQLKIFEFPVDIEENNGVNKINTGLTPRIGSKTDDINLIDRKVKKYLGIYSLRKPKIDRDISIQSNSTSRIDDSQSHLNIEQSIESTRFF